MSEISSKAPVVVNPPRLSPKPSSPQPISVVRDKDYYHSSGDLVFVVENTLFKVNNPRSVAKPLKVTLFQIHRFQLERSCGSPPSAHKLAPLIGEKFIKTMTGEDAFVLQEKADEFRALCWALYAPYVLLTYSFFPVVLTTLFEDPMKSVSSITLRISN